MGMADSYKIELSRLRPGGATNGQVLTYSTTTGTWYPATGGGGGTPAGSDTEIQFNNAGAFGGSAKFRWDDDGSEFGDPRLIINPGASTAGIVFYDETGAQFGTLHTSSSLVAEQDWALPNLSGTLAVTSQIKSASGGAGTVQLSNGSGEFTDGVAATHAEDLTITDSSKGFVLTSPDTTTARITIDDADVLQGVTAYPPTANDFDVVQQAGVAMAVQPFRIENRTSDPGAPAIGQIWLRTDL